MSSAEGVRAIGSTEDVFEFAGWFVAKHERKKTLRSKTAQMSYVKWVCKIVGNYLPFSMKCMRGSAVPGECDLPYYFAAVVQREQGVRACPISRPSWRSRRSKCRRVCEARHV